MRACTACVSAVLFLAASCRASQAEQPLPLPNTPSAPGRELKLGEKIALDELGPLIVTADGSLRRIANWADLSEAEQRVALKRLGKRNQERLATLEELQASQATTAAAAATAATGGDQQRQTEPARDDL